MIAISKGLIGIMGGTFDPIHYGHLAIAEEARWALDLDRVYVVPAAEQPFKRGHQHASPRQRLEMVRLACATNPALIPSDIEVRRPPPSYTIDTLRELQARLGPDVTLWFIVGADALADLPRWRQVDQVLALARLAVVGRPGATVDLTALDRMLPGMAGRTAILEGPRLDISSSSLRQRLAAGKPVRYQLPDAVLAYIDTHRLYRRDD